jgi:hypothetical protein
LEIERSFERWRGGRLAGEREPGKRGESAWASQDDDRSGDRDAFRIMNKLNEMFVNDEYAARS